MKKKLWLFGGYYKPFSKFLTKGFDVYPFGRWNTDYNDVESFISNIESDSIPDLIVFNIANNGYNPVFDKEYTPIEEIHEFRKILLSTFYFQLRITEWFFHNFENKRILWLTSFEPNNMEVINEKEFDGDMLIYRMSRTIEHQVIHQQNIKPSNLSKNNKIMGICVGNNAEGTPQKINELLVSDDFHRGVFAFGEESISRKETPSYKLQLTRKNLTEYKIQEDNNLI